MTVLFRSFSPNLIHLIINSELMNLMETKLYVYLSSKSFTKKDNDLTDEKHKHKCSYDFIVSTQS